MKLLSLALAFIVAGAVAVRPPGSAQPSLGNQARKERCTFNHVRAGWDWPDRDEACGWRCGGSSQSPISISRDPGQLHGFVAAPHRAHLQFGVASNLRVLNLGHAAQVEFDTPAHGRGSVVVCGDSVYSPYAASGAGIAEGVPSRACRRVPVRALQFHLHSTSEHLIGGRSSMLELHLVTQLVGDNATLPVECQAASSQCLAVFAAQFDLKVDAHAPPDPTIQRIIDAFPSPADCPLGTGPTCKRGMAGTLDLRTLLPAGGRYYTYSGSLTTPPCSEGVMWHVFDTARATVSEEQALDLQLALSTALVEGEEGRNRLNNRATQPRNGRRVYVSA